MNAPRLASMHPKHHSIRLWVRAVTNLTLRAEPSGFATGWNASTTNLQPSYSVDD
jgi:hypothetical protein